MEGYKLISCIYDYVVSCLNPDVDLDDLRKCAARLIRLNYLEVITEQYGDLSDCYIYHTADKLAKVIKGMEV